LAGVVIPNADVSVIPELARSYGITHVVIETFRDGVAVPKRFGFALNNPPEFLIRLSDTQFSGAVVYEIRP